MVKNHLKRLNTPTTWTLKRKGILFVAKPSAGPHSRRLSMPLHLVFKNLLGYAKTARDVRNILNKNTVMIDGKQVKNYKFPIGFMDSLSVKETNECFRMSLTKKGKLGLNKISIDEGKQKVCKIVGKTQLGKEKTQLNFLDGKNIIAKKDDFKVGDSIILDTSAKKITKHLKLEKGAAIMILGGKRTGITGTVEDIKEKVMIFTDEAGNNIETKKRYAFVIEKNMLGRKDKK